MTDDNELWEQEMRAARKLSTKEKFIGEQPTKKKIVIPAQAEIPPSTRSTGAEMDSRLRGNDRFLTLGDSSHVDGKLAEKLRKGNLPIEAKIDLHGMTQDEAFPALYRCITEAYASGKRCVLVVTGKGTRSETGRGVLQQAVPEWLNLPEIRPAILMFCHAQPTEGGSGALYVLLKRQRMT